MLKLKRLKIEKFRNVKPGTELRFSDGFNIVLGQNGTGKTTLLELISRVVRSEFRDCEREEFALTYALEAGSARIDVEFKNERRVSVAWLPERPLQASEPFMPFVAVRISGSGTNVECRHENGKLLLRESSLTAPQEFPAQSGPALSFALFHAISAASRQRARPEQELQFRELVHAVVDRNRVRFDESLDVFGATFGSAEFPGTHAFVFNALMAIDTRFWPIPKDVLSGIESQIRQQADATAFTIPDPDLEFLSRAVRLMGFASADLRIDVLQRSVTEGEPTPVLTLGNQTARLHFDGGGFITHDRLSYGQKRLLTFFYYVASNPDLVIADELVNGLHHQWIRECIDAIGERQAFLTSQNPLLLDYLPFTSPEQVQQSFVLCKSEREEGHRPRWNWTNMSEEQAKTFFSAYEVGIEHVSEILQTQGLF